MFKLLLVLFVCKSVSSYCVLPDGNPQLTINDTLDTGNPAVTEHVDEGTGVTGDGVILPVVTGEGSSTLVDAATGPAEETTVSSDVELTTHKEEPSEELKSTETVHESEATIGPLEEITREDGSIEVSTETESEITIAPLEEITHKDGPVEVSTGPDSTTVPTRITAVNGGSPQSENIDETTPLIQIDPVDHDLNDEIGDNGIYGGNCDKDEDEDDDEDDEEEGAKEKEKETEEEEEEVEEKEKEAEEKEKDKNVNNYGKNSHYYHHYGMYPYFPIGYYNGYKPHPGYGFIYKNKKQQAGHARANGDAKNVHSVKLHSNRQLNNKETHHSRGHNKEAHQSRGHENHQHHVNRHHSKRHNKEHENKNHEHHNKRHHNKHHSRHHNAHESKKSHNRNHESKNHHAKQHEKRNNKHE